MNNSNNQERYYNILKLNKWFAISSIIFTAFWIIVFADDYNRPWKKYQIEFRDIEIEKIKADIESENIALQDNSDYEVLLDSLDKSKNDLELETSKVNEINSQLGVLEAKLYGDNQNFQFSKADMDAQRYKYEEALFGYGNAEEEEKKFLAPFKKLSILKIRIAKKTSTKDRAAAEILLYAPLYIFIIAQVNV